MYGLYGRGDPETHEELKQLLEIPEQCLRDFGDHAVVILNVKQFLRRIKDAVSHEGYTCGARLVTYYDRVQPVFTKDEDGAFYKREQYSYEPLAKLPRKPSY